MRNINILYYISKISDLLFVKYWAYTYIFGFLIFLCGILPSVIDTILNKKQRGLNAKLALDACI